VTADPAGQRLPLTALLSQVLVAFTIEFDNEFERQMPHRTTRHGSTAGAGGRRGPWLVSMVMWSNCMQYVPEEGIAVRELARRARITDKSMRLVLTRMGAWWGYLVAEPPHVRPTPAGVASEWAESTLGRLRKSGHVVVGPDPAGTRARVARLTAKGAAAQRAYREHLDVIEQHWSARLGRDRISSLRQVLEGLAGDPAAERPPLLAGLPPCPDGWRASIAAPRTLPHYPLVLHRGGFPDGS
jgi:hypothetical protein